MTIHLTAVFAFCLSSTKVTAAVFSGLYSYGDSLSDAGNTNLATGGALPGAGYYNGRYSNGPVWVERLAGYLGMPAASPSLLGGKNSAWAGAYTLSGGSVPPIAQQVAMFTGAGGTYLPTDVVTLWGGANDFLLGGQLNPTIPAGNVLGIITTLAGAGAKTILLPNLPDLGDTPALLSTNDPSSILGASMWTQGFNQTLASQVSGLESTFGIDIVLLDIYAIGKAMKNNPGAYGFTNTTDAALLTGNAAFADQYLYWDSVHPTSGVHDIFAREGARLLGVPEPSTTMILLLFGCSVIWCRQRRCADLRFRGVRLNSSPRTSYSPKVMKSKFSKATCHNQTSRNLLKSRRFGWLRCLLPQIGLVLFAAGLTSCGTLVTSIDHKKEDWENAYLWRRMNDEPAVFHPKALPRGAPVTPATGEWVVDPQNHAAFFVPNAGCGGLTSTMWRAEALKGVNKFSRGRQTARNIAMVVLGWPAYPVLNFPNEPGQESFPFLRCFSPAYPY